MNLSFLRSFVASVRLGSLAAAAKELHLTPSAISLQMKRVEQYMGCQLFDRAARQIQPTPQAVELAKLVQLHLDGLDSLRRTEERVASGLLTLGAVESVQVSLLPVLMRLLQKRAPDLRLHITRGVSSALLEDVKAARLDAAILVRPASGGSSRLHWIELHRERYVMIAPPNAPDLPPDAMFRRYGWIRFDRATTGGRVAAQFVGKISPRTHSMFDLPGIDAIVASVSAGIGISVVPRPRAALRSFYDYQEISLGRGAPLRTIAFVCRTADVDNPRIMAVRSAAEASIQHPAARVI